MHPEKRRAGRAIRKARRESRELAQSERIADTLKRMSEAALRLVPMFEALGAAMTGAVNAFLEAFRPAPVRADYALAPGWENADGSGNPDGGTVGSPQEAPAPDIRHGRDLIPPTHSRA